jgi:hypothetical protein
MSILLNPSSGYSTDKHPRRSRSKFALGYSLESFMLPDRDRTEFDGSAAVIVDVSEEGHRLLEKSFDTKKAGEKNEDIPTVDFLKSRVR